MFKKASLPGTLVAAVIAWIDSFGVTWTNSWLGFDSSHFTVFNDPLAPPPGLLLFLPRLVCTIAG